MRFHRRLAQSCNGATAIEYAIIAGLIGLGLVGSLVTTRGSLSAIFGTTATKMDGGSPVGGAGQALWGSKTLAKTQVFPSGGVRQPDGSVKGGQVQYKYTYSDGSYVEFTNQRDSNNNITSSSIFIMNPAVDPNNTYNYKFDADGKQTFFERDTYAPGSNYGTIRSYSYQNLSGTSQMNGTCNGPGNCTPSGVTDPKDDFIAAIASTVAQVEYFQATSAKLPIT